MNYKRLLFSMALAALLFSACKKDHYDLKNVNGAHVEGELLLPLASESITVMDLMQRFSSDDVIGYDPSGNMSFSFSYEYLNALDAHEILRIDDAGFDQHFAFANPFPTELPITIDTSMSFNQNLSLSSDNLRLMSAALNSGTLGINIESNVFQIQHAKITCPQIRYADGSVMSFDFYPGASNVIDMGGLSFMMEEQNTMNFNYDIDFVLQGTTAPELYFDAHLMFADLTFSEINGWIDAYTTSSTIDTTFSLFPNNLFGQMEIDGFDLAMSVRSGFGMPARLTITEALLSGPNIEPYPIFSQMPQVIGINPSAEYEEVFNQTLTGRLDAQGGRVQADFDFTLNPEGMANMVTVSEDNTLDFKMDANIPFAFKIDEVRYIDTIDLRVSSIESSELLKKLTIQITTTSDIPFNLNSDILMYNTEEQSVVGTLVNAAPMLRSSFDGQMCSSTFDIEVDGETLDKLMQSDKLIMNYDVDTDGHHVVLNANQTLQIYMKAKLDYDGIVEPDDNNE